MTPRPAHARDPRFGIAFAQAAVICCLGAAVAAWLQPEPYSDWLYYWTAAGSPDAYQRGGAGLWLLALPKALGLPPYAAALALNIPIVVALLLLIHRYDDGARQSRAWMVAAYLLLLVPFLGIVQLDMLAALAIVLGFVAMQASRWPLAVLAFAAAASTKPQYTLVMLAVVVLGAVAWLSFRRWPPARAIRPRMLAAMAIGAVLGLGLDMGLRGAADQVGSVRASSAVTLYAGLLVQAEGRKCGYWSEAAAQAALDDMDKPLAAAIVERLAAEPATHWAGVVACKLPEIVMPHGYAVGWLAESPNVQGKVTQGTVRNLRRFEHLACTLVAAWILAAAWLAALRRRGSAPATLAALLWVLGFWSVHAVFEIQGRYFLGMFLVVPFLLALRDGGPAPREPRVPRDGVA